MAKKVKVDSAIETLSTKDIEAELVRRRKGLSSLVRRRDRLRAQLAEVEQSLRESGGEPGVRVRPRNTVNLVEALSKVLTNKTMSVSQVAEAVQRAGYQTYAANFRTIVNQTLLKHKKLFKKVSRGQYTAL